VPAWLLAFQADGVHGVAELLTILALSITWPGASDHLHAYGQQPPAQRSAGSAPSAPMVAAARRTLLAMIFSTISGVIGSM